MIGFVEVQGPYALVIGNPTTPTPTPEKHGAYVGVMGDWTFLCAPWGGGLGQFRQLSSLMSNTEGDWDRLNAHVIQNG